MMNSGKIHVDEEDGHGEGFFLHHELHVHLHHPFDHDNTHIKAQFPLIYKIMRVKSVLFLIIKHALDIIGYLDVLGV